MLSREEARARLATYAVTDPKTPSGLTLIRLGGDARGLLKLLQGKQDDGGLARRLDDMSSKRRTKLIAAFAPSLAVELSRLWEWAVGVPYQSGWTRSRTARPFPRPAVRTASKCSVSCWGWCVSIRRTSSGSHGGRRTYFVLPRGRTAPGLRDLGGQHPDSRHADRLGSRSGRSRRHGASGGHRAARQQRPSLLGGRREHAAAGATAGGATAGDSGNSRLRTSGGIPSGARRDRREQADQIRGNRPGCLRLVRRGFPRAADCAPSTASTPSLTISPPWAATRWSAGTRGPADATARCAR